MDYESFWRILCQSPEDDLIPELRPLLQQLLANPTDEQLIEAVLQQFLLRQLLAVFAFISSPIQAVGADESKMWRFEGGDEHECYESHIIVLARSSDEAKRKMIIRLLHAADDEIEDEVVAKAEVAIVARTDPSCTELEDYARMTHITALDIWPKDLFGLGLEPELVKQISELQCFRWMQTSVLFNIMHANLVDCNGMFLSNRKD